MASWDLSPHLLAILEGACRELDRAAEAEAAASGEPWLKDRYGAVKSHPGVGVARSSRLAAGRLLKALDLELPATGPYGGPGHGGVLRKPEESP